MSKAGRVLGLLFTKLTFIGGLYLGVFYNTEIKKLYYNVFERNVPVSKECYPGIGEVSIYFDKRKGKIIHSYGTEDYKIPIGKDLAPVDMFSLQMKRLKNGYSSKPDKILDMLEYVVDKNQFPDSLVTRVEKLNRQLNPEIQKYYNLNLLNNYLLDSTKMNKQKIITEIQ